MPINRIESRTFDIERENYIPVLRSELSITDIGWRIYNDSSAIPIDGIGGTTTITWTQNTSNPLNGDSDLRLVKDANNRQGEGVSIDFTVSNRHLAKVLQITLDSEFINGTFSTGDLKFYIIANPGTTNTVIEPVNVSLQLGIANQRIKHIASFQTGVSITSYRFCIHVASTSTSNYTVDFNNFKVWEPTQSIGSIITDWQSYTPTGTNFTISSSSMYFKRSGGDLLLQGTITLSGSASSGEFRVSLPSGLTINSSSVPSIRDAGRSICSSTGFNSPGWQGVILIEGNTGYITFGRDNGTTNGFTKLQATDSSLASGLSYSILATIPIQGWGSSVAMSSDMGDSRSIEAIITGVTSQSITTTNGIIFNTKLRDTHNAIVLSSGTGTTFTAPVSGLYNITGSGIVLSGNEYLLARVNTTNLYAIGVAISNATGLSITGDVFMNAGDVLRIVSASNMTVSGATYGVLGIKRISAGSQVLSASETVACEVWTDTTTTASSSVNFLFNRVNRDTHGAWNTTTGIYTAPMSGWYNFNLMINPNSSPASSGTIDLYKASVGGSFAKYKMLAYVVISSSFPSGIGSIYLLAGEQISFRYSTGSYTANGTTTLASNSSWLTINRVGN